MTWLILREVAALLLLFIPTVWEQWNDRNGDDHSNKADLYARAGLVLSAAFLTWIVSGHSFGAALALCAAIHFLIFDYWVAYRLESNGVIKPGSSWFRYVGKSSDFDQRSAWVKAGPWGRLAARVAVFIIAIFFYFKITF